MSFKKDEETGVSSFYQDKVGNSCSKPERESTERLTSPLPLQTSVIQEARVFNETPISPRKCRILLTKVIYLLYNGESFNRQEATTLFFGATKLFQHKDVSQKARTLSDFLY